MGGGEFGGVNFLRFSLFHRGKNDKKKARGTLFESNDSNISFPGLSKKL